MLCVFDDGDAHCVIIISTAEESEIPSILGARPSYSKQYIQQKNSSMSGRGCATYTVVVLLAQPQFIEAG